MVAACPFPTSQGSQVLIRELSEALVRRGHELHIVTYHFGENHPCPGLNIHRIPELFPYSKFRSGPSFRKLVLDLLLAAKLDQVVRQQGIQLIHCHNYEAPVAAFPVRLLRRVPIVYHSHNTMSDEFYTYFRLKIPQIAARGIAHLMDRFIPRYTDFVIAINRKVADFLIEMGTSPKKVKYIPPGIDFGDPVEEVKTDLRNEFELGTGPLIIYAGNLDGYQRIDLLLDALKQVTDKYENVKLAVITGSSTQQLVEDAVSRKVRDSLRIIPNPGFSTIKEVFALGIMAVNPRISWSGFPIKLLNYMAAGLPVVAFDGAAPPVVHEYNGLLAKSADSEDYAGMILKLLDSPEQARKLGETARKTVSEQYDWDVIVQEIEQIYFDLLDRKSKS